MDDNFTLKEILKDLVTETKAQSKDIATITEKISGIEGHLEKLNSKVATHEKRFGEQDKFVVRVTSYVTVFAGGVSLLINKFL